MKCFDNDELWNFHYKIPLTNCFHVSQKKLQQYLTFVTKK